MVRIAGFLLTGIVLLVCLNWVSNYFDPVFCEGKLRIKILVHDAETIEALAVGNSRNRAIDFDVLALRGFHLWKGGSDLFETCYQLRAMVPLLPNLKMVFISLDGMNFLHDNRYAEDRHEIRRAYYATTPGLRSFKPIRGDFKNLVKGKLSAIIRQDHWRGVLDSMAVYFKERRYRRPDKTFAEKCDVDERGYIGSRIYERMSVDSSTVRVEKVRFLIAATKRYYQENPNIHIEVCKELLSILRFLHERQVRTVFFTPPYSQTYLEMISEAAVNTNELANKHLYHLREKWDAEIYDFSNDSTFSKNFDFFSDIDHLNADGARLFSEKLKRVCESKDPF